MKMRHKEYHLNQGDKDDGCVKLDELTEKKDDDF